MSSAAGSTLVTSWRLVSAAMPEFFANETSLGELELILDQANCEFGILLNNSLGTVSMARCTDDSAAYFDAACAISACYSLQGTKSNAKNPPKTVDKVAVLLSKGQVDLHFTNHGDVMEFLLALKSLASTHFTMYEIRSTEVSAFSRLGFDMVKAGYGGFQGVTSPLDPTPSTQSELWKTGNWSDLIVVAGQTEFRVHRSVLCPKSLFFDAACRPPFAESTSGRIHLDEDETTIGILLSELYDVRSPATGSLFTTFALMAEIEKGRMLSQLLKVCVAADKYQLDDIKRRTARAIAVRFPLVQDAGTIIELAQDIDASCPENDQGLRDAVVDNIQARLPMILTLSEGLSELMESRFLIEALITRFGRLIGSGVLPARANGSRDPGLTTPPTSPFKKYHTRTSPGGVNGPI